MDDLGATEGIVEPTKVALIDADTIAYASACGAEYADDKLSEEFYTPKEWQAIISDPQWDEKEHCVWVTNVEEAIASSVERIQEIVGITDTTYAELYFTQGRNFRYDLYDMYKGNRKDTRYPAGLNEIKEALLEKYEGAMCREYEADDMVVMLKRTQPDHYVLCAVDKDVYKAVGGRHFNYYRSARYGIDMKWLATTHASAKKFPYLQCMMGDPGDNIPGCPGIGPKKAEAALKGLDTPEEMWAAVVKMFKSKKLTVKDALRDFRLVNMNQLTIDKEIVLWTPPMVS